MLLNLFQWLLKLLAQLPLSVLRGLATGIGFVVWFSSRKVRRTVASNLAQAGLSDVKGLSVRSVVQANVRGLLDMVWVWFNSSEQVCASCTINEQDRALITRTHQANCNYILLTPHLGCFEALAKWYSTQTPLTAMYRRPNKAWLAAFLQAARVGQKLTMASADTGGVRLALKTLKSGGKLGVLPDQAPKLGEGIWLPWFGRDAYTITLPAKLHLSTGAPMVIFAALPIKGGWEIVCDPVDAPAGLSAEQLTAHLNQALESMVLRAPLHYAWSYKRYKGSPESVRT